MARKSTDQDKPVQLKCRPSSFTAHCAGNRLPGAGLCAVSALFASLLSFLPFLIADQGFFTLAYDYNHQQIPFTAAAAEGIRGLFSGEWIWNLDLGSSLITGFGFYNLGSPFFWMTLPFPKESFPCLAVFIYTLKYMTAAVVAYGWLRQFVKADRFAVLGGLLYAFSGFQSTNLLFYHFHDIVAFFPLLPWALDRLMKEKKDLLFPFAVFLNCLVNYTFFVQEAIFLILYFLFRYFRKNHVAEGIKTALGLFLRALLGIAMAAFLFLPNVIYVLYSARGKIQLDWNQLGYDLKGILFILKGFLWPGEAMSEQSVLFQYQFGSTSLYLPFFGMSFVLLYLIHNRGWLKKMLILLFLVSFSPLIQSGFLLFTEPSQRWWYMLNLLCVLATILVLEKEQFAAPHSFRLSAAYAGGVLLYCILLWVARGSSGGTLLYSRKLFVLFGGLAVLSAAACAFMAQRHLLIWKNVFAAVLAGCVATTCAAIAAYKRGDEHAAVKQDYMVGLQLESIQDQYRYASSHNLYLMPGHGSGIGAFSSTAENSSYAFRSKVYDFNANFTYQSIVFNGLPELLGGKYEIIEEVGDQPLVRSFEVNGRRYGIAEKPACPIGFATENFITLEELQKYPREDRSFVLMDAVVVEDPEKAAGFREKRFAENRSPENPSQLIQRAEENKVHQFRRDSRGFRCATNYLRDQLVFFSVPNDAGWTARLDGEKVEIIDSCGMMALRVPAGSHEISFTYRTPGFQPGLILSLAGWMLYISAAVLRKHPRRRRPVPHG